MTDNEHRSVTSGLFAREPERSSPDIVDQLRAFRKRMPAIWHGNAMLETAISEILGLRAAIDTRASQPTTPTERQASDAPIWYSADAASAWADGYNTALDALQPGAALAEPATVAADLDSGNARPNRELDSPDRGHQSSAGSVRLADELQRLCCAETEGKFFDCVTDNIDTIIRALRGVTQPFPCSEYANWTLHRQPNDLIADHKFSIWSGDHPVVLANEVPGEEGALAHIVNLLNVAQPAPDVMAALKPFAEVGLDVLKNRPGWANEHFASEWAGRYRLSYIDFERAAAVVLTISSTDGDTP